MRRQDGCTCGRSAAPPDGSHLSGCPVVPMAKPDEGHESVRSVVRNVEKPASANQASGADSWLPQAPVEDALDAAIEQLALGMDMTLTADRIFRASPELSRWVADGYALAEAKGALPAGHWLVLRSTADGWEADIESERGPEIVEPFDTPDVAQSVACALVARYMQNEGKA